MIKKYFKVVKTNITPPKEIGQNYLWIDTSEDTWVWKIYRDGAWREIGVGEDVIDAKLKEVYEKLSEKQDVLPIVTISQFAPVDVVYNGVHYTDQLDLFSAVINGPEMSEAVIAALGITKDNFREFILCDNQVEYNEYTKPHVTGYEWNGYNGTIYWVEIGDYKFIFDYTTDDPDVEHPEYHLTGHITSNRTLKGSDVSQSIVNVSTKIPSSLAVKNALSNKQDKLDSSAVVGTINGTQLTWGGDITISGGGGEQISIDNDLSPTSPNAVKNSAITDAIKGCDIIIDGTVISPAITIDGRTCNTRYELFNAIVDYNGDEDLPSSYFEKLGFTSQFLNKLQYGAHVSLYITEDDVHYKKITGGVVYVDKDDDSYNFFIGDYCIWITPGNVGGIYNDNVLRNSNLNGTISFYEERGVRGKEIYNALLSKADTSNLSHVAFSGSYDDLSDKPTIPIIPTNVSSFINDAGYLTKHQDITGKAEKSEMSVSLNGDQTTITLKSGLSATVINEHQDISTKQNNLGSVGSANIPIYVLNNEAKACSVSSAVTQGSSALITSGAVEAYVNTIVGNINTILSSLTTLNP